MKKIETPLILATGYALIYNMLPFLGYTDNIIVPMFILSPFVLVWMAVKILKHGEPSSKVWDDYFYEDHLYRRNGKEG